MAGIRGIKIVKDYSYYQYESDYEAVNRKCDDAIKAINKVRERELAELNARFRAANPTENDIAKIPESQFRRMAEIVKEKVESGETLKINEMTKPVKKTETKKTEIKKTE